MNEENIVYDSFLVVEIFNFNYIVLRSFFIDDNLVIILWGVWLYIVSGVLYGVLMDYFMYIIFFIMVEMKVYVYLIWFLFVFNLKCKKNM